MIGDVDPSVQNALDTLTKVFGNAPMHVNFGQSEHYVEGFNNGFDDAETGFPNRKDAAPLYEPFRSAYERGYDEGWETWDEHQEDTES